MRAATTKLKQKKRENSHIRIGMNEWRKRSEHEEVSDRVCGMSLPAKEHHG